MPTGTIQSTAAIGGQSMAASFTREAATDSGTKKTLVAAETAVLTTRTNDTDGSITMDEADHTIETGDVIDIYWSVQTSPEQATAGVAYGATVGEVAGKVVPFTGASGVLPIETSVLNVDEQVPLDIDFDGDKLQMIVAVLSTRGHIEFEDSGNATLDAEELSAAEPYQFVADTGQANPLTGNPVDEIMVSNGDATAPGIFQMGYLLDSDT